MKRQVVVAIIAALLFTGATQPAQAQFSLPGFPTPKDLIPIPIQTLKKIYDELARKKKDDDGLSVNLEQILRTILRAFPEGEKLLNEVDDQLAVVQDIRREIKNLSCNWHFSRSDPTAPFRQLFDIKMWLCKPQLERMFGTDRMTGFESNGPLYLPGSDLNEFYDYVTTINLGQASGRAQSTNSSWFRVFKETHDDSAANRTAPGQAERDTAVMMAMIQKVEAVNAATIGNVLLVRQLDAAEDEREERLRRQVAAWMYSAR